jgi:NAD(P)-dependent dehydrogenase (short-subunit alcohol dehydrogenase family)
MVQHHWTETDIPSQRGKNFVVTGTGGLGYAIARALAQAGGDVMIAGRNPERGAQAILRIKASYSGAKIKFEKRIALASAGRKSML